jgi:glutamate racemase
MKPAADLVIMDWGIGGLSVYNEVRLLLPKLSILYYSDSGVTPYGKMPARELEARIHSLVMKFSEEGIQHFLIACNAASTVLPRLEKKFKSRGLCVTGVIEHGIELIRKSKHRRFAVIGGRRTILARSYTKPFRQGRHAVTGRIAQPLSALIEAGELSSPKMHATLARILGPLKNYDSVLLACTHYPAVAAQIQRHLPEVQLLDPARSTAAFIKKNWRWPKTARAPQWIFATSGDPKAMRRSAALAFKVRISDIRSVKA